MMTVQEAQSRPNPASAPIFVIGSGRSGTTLLRLMLCAHPRIYLTHEAMFYLLEPRFLRKMRARAGLKSYFRSPAFRSLGVDSEKVLVGLPDPLPSGRIGEVYAALMRAKAAQYGRVRFGDKTPANTQYIDRIFRDFPDARVIRIIRDPRSTAESLTVVPFGSPSIVVTALSLRPVQRAADRYRDRILTVRLEDLLADGRSVMKRALDFVGEPWDDAVLDHSRHVADLNDMPPHPWLHGAKRERKAAVATWQSRSPAQVRLVEWLTRRSMQEGGYEPARFDSEPGTLALWAEFFRHVPELWRVVRVMVRVSWAYALHGEKKANETLFGHLNPGSWERYSDPPPRENAHPRRV